MAWWPGCIYGSSMHELMEVGQEGEVGLEENTCSCEHPRQASSRRRITLSSKSRFSTHQDPLLRGHRGFARDTTADDSKSSRFSDDVSATQK